MPGRGTAPKEVSKAPAAPIERPRISPKPDPQTLAQRKKARNAALREAGLQEEKINEGVSKGDLSKILKKTAKKVAAKKREKRKVCGSPIRDPERQGEKCNHTAGWGTSHPGFGHCKWHGGNSPSHIKSAESEMVRERMAAESSLYGRKRDIGPHEALIEEVQRTAGHVQWLHEKIQRFESESDLVQDTPKDGMKESEWIVMYQNERKMLVSVCNTAIRAGIAERTVRIAEDQGKLIAQLLMTFINNPELALTPTQMAFAPRLARNLLLELSSGEQQAPQRIIGNEVVDADVISDRVL